MKLNRAALKEIIKECVVEVLQESFSSEAKPRATSNLREGNRPQKRSRPARKSHLDNIKFDKSVNEAAESLSPDPIMQSIFADTAKTTLQDQISAARHHAPAPAGADRAAQVAASYDPEDLFEGAGNWAALAFSEKGPPRG